MTNNVTAVATADGGVQHFQHRCESHILLVMHFVGPLVLGDEACTDMRGILDKASHQGNQKTTTKPNYNSM